MVTRRARASRGQSASRSVSSVSNTTRHPKRSASRRNACPFSYEAMQRIVGFVGWSVTTSRTPVPLTLRHRFLSERLLYPIFKLGKWRRITSGAQPGHIGLSVVLIAVLQAAGNRDELDLARAMHLHQRLRHSLERPRLSCPASTSRLHRLVRPA